MLHPKVNGRWLRSVGAWTDVRYTTGEHGSETLWWRMRKDSRPVIPRGSLVTLCPDLPPVWAGILTEAGPEEYVAQGLWKRTKGPMALDGSNNPSWTVDTAIDAAITRGALPGCFRPASISNSAMPNDGTPIKLQALLDLWATTTGGRWRVDPDGGIRSYTIGAPVWHVTPGTRPLALADDNFVTALVGSYLAAGPVFATTAPVVNTAAAASHGYEERTVDLTPLGVISGATATATLTTMLAQAGPRLSYSEGLQLVAGQLTNGGGAPAALELVRGGDVVRVHGVSEESNVTTFAPYSDIILGQTDYSEGARSIGITPEGLAARSLDDILKVVFTIPGLEVA